MGKASSSKKVQRAAKAAATSRGVGEQRERGFPILVGIIVLLGIGLVLLARESRDDLIAPFLQGSVTNGDDHWHIGYEIYDCGELHDPVLNEFDPDGIHTHGDGLIHVHPFNSSATGKDARLQVFMDASGLSITDDGITADEAAFADIDGSSGCGDQESEIKIARYAAGENEEPVTVYDGDFGDIRFLENLETLIIAKVPVGEDPPVPGPTVLAQLVTHGADTSLSSDAPIQLDPLDPAADDPTITVPAEEDPATEEDPAAEEGEITPDVDPEVEGDPVPDAEQTDTTTTVGGDE